MEKNSRPFARTGALLWLGCIQFFAVQIAVTATWRTHYDIVTNYISDLGAVHCAYFPPASRVYVCSPFHAIMNASMFFQGMLMAGGAACCYAASRRRRVDGISAIAVALAGFGSMIVGIFPEDVAGAVHYSGAALHLTAGNIGVLVLGWSLIVRQRRLGIVICVLGAVGAAATLALGANQQAGLGIGGMERLAVYPFPLCLMLYGAAVLGGQRRASAVA